MRAVIQRVSRARVSVGGATTGAIDAGLLVLLGVGREDTAESVAYLVEKICGLRIFPDQEGKMNLSLPDTAGAMLVVSQFTLYGDVRKGRRPAFDRAAPPDQAKLLYELFVETARQRGIRVETGIFQAMMEVELVNQGPVTILCDSERMF